MATMAMTAFGGSSIPDRQQYDDLLKRYWTQLVRSVDSSERFLSDLSAIGAFEGKLSDIRRTSDTKAIADKILTLPSDEDYERSIGPFLSVLRENGHEHVANVFITGSNEDLLTESDYELLLNKLKVLCDYLDPECGVVPLLRRKGVFRMSDEKRISAHKTANQKVEQIIKILLCKSKSSYQRFIESLQETDQEHVTYILTGFGNPPISKEDLKLIRRKRQDVCKLMDSTYTSLLTTLVSLEVFTDSDRQRIEAKGKVNLERSKQILDILARKSKRHFDNFIRALKETDQKHVADLLCNDLSITGTVNVNFSRVPSSEQEQKSVEEKLKSSLEKDLENEESEINTELDSIGIHGADISFGCILIRFKFLSSETLDAMHRGKLDDVFTERYRKLFPHESIKSIHIDISETEIERCRQLIDKRGAVMKPEHQEGLKEATQILQNMTVDERLLKEIPLCKDRLNAILEQNSDKEKAEVLLEVMDRRPDYEFYQFLDVLRRKQPNIAAHCTKPLGKNWSTFRC